MTRYTLAALPLLLALTACPSNRATTNTVITTVAGAEIALTAADSVATTYIKQTACPTGVVKITCSDAATAAMLKSYGQKAHDVLKQAQAGTVTLAVAVAALNAFTSATPISTVPPATTP